MAELCLYEVDVEYTRSYGHSAKLQDRCCSFTLLESKARDF